MQKLFNSYAKLVISHLEKEDHNKDGSLNIDGFRAAMLISEVKQFMDKSEVDEAFNLLENHQGELAYRRWITTDPFYSKFA